MIGMLLGFLSLLISPFGMLFFLMGLVCFLCLPMVSRVTNYFHAFARLHLWLGARMLKRASIVLSEHGDLILKRMSPDDIGTETIEFNDDTKEFEDQNERKAKSSWMGIPFALADEVHGFLFTPIEAALGERKARAEKQDEMVVKATAKERQMYDTQGWVRGLFEFPDGKYELPDLNMARQLVTGSERAEHPQRVDTFYELSREPYEEGTGAAQFIMIIVALIGPFAGIWVLSSQLGLGGIGGGPTPDSSVSYGVAMLFASFTSATSVLKNVDWKRVAVAIPVLGILPAIYLLLILFTNPVYATMLFVIMGMGFWTVPILIELMKVSDKLTNSVAGLLLKSGLFGYDEPVFEYTPRGYKIREYNKLDVSDHKVTWHPFLGRRFGFTFTPTTDSFDVEVADKEDMDNRAVADGGVKTNIPSGFQRIPERTRAVYGLFIPNRLKESHYYIKTGIALERMKNVATGEKSHKRLTQSKEEHGGTGGLSETSVMYAVVGCGMFSFVAGLAVFVVPAFL